MEWLVKEIERGLAGLVIMRVPGFPPAEQMENVVRVWSGALSSTRKWDEAQDVDRIREAFRQLVLLSKRWPTVSEFLEVLPMRDAAPAQTIPVQRQLEVKTDERPDAEHRARMLETFNQRMAEYVKSPERIAQMEKERKGFEYKGKTVRIPWTCADIYNEWMPCNSVAEILARVGAKV